MAKPPPQPRQVVVEFPPKSLSLARKKPVPRVVVEISEGSATLVRCPFKDVDVEIQDYDVPDDWNPENIGQFAPNLETGIRTDAFGRRYQFFKFNRRSKTS